MRNNTPVLNTRHSDRQKQRLNALAGVFTKTDRILKTDRNVTVKFLYDNGARPDIERARPELANVPGYTEYPNIYINIDKFDPSIDKRTLVQLLGLNYHELAHQMFTPRKFATRYLNDDECRAFNILEDQRIESLFTAMYEPAGKFFTEMVIRFMVEDTRAWETAFALTYGRSFLPKEIRDEFEARFAMPRKRKDFKRVIDEYKSYKSSDFVNNTGEVAATVREFAALIRTLTKKTGDPVQPNCADQDPIEGYPDQKTEDEAHEDEKRRREVEEETGEDQSGFWDEEDDSEEESEDGDEQAGEGSDSGEDSEDDDEDSDGDGGDSDDDSSDGDGAPDSGGGEGEEPDSDSSQEDQEEVEEEVSEEDGSGSGGDGVGNSTGPSTKGDFFDDELKDYLKEIIEAVNEDEAVENEVEQINSAMRDRNNLDFIEFGKEDPLYQPVSGLESFMVRQVTQHFRRLYSEVEPGWRYGSDHGRLNVGRAMRNPEDYDEHFDEWEEGRELESGLEVVIALDVSGSMLGAAITDASRALWIIKRALDDVGAKTTVLGFSDYTKGLYSRNQNATRGVWPVWNNLGPNTCPANSFHIARQILNATDMPNKLFVILTDGDWSAINYEANDSAQYKIENLPNLIQQIPGEKMYVGVTGGASSNSSIQQLFDSAVDLGRDANGLVQVVKDSVTNIIRNIERRR